MSEHDMTLTERILQAVDRQPGIASGQIFALISEVEPKNIGATLCNLVKQHRLDRTGVPRNFHYFPGGEAPDRETPPQADTTRDDEATVAPAAGPVRTIVAAEMRRKVAAGAAAAKPPIIETAPSVKGGRASAPSAALSITADGAVSIPTPGGLVTLDVEETRALGRFLMFTMAVWEAAPCS